MTHRPGAAGLARHRRRDGAAGPDVAAKAGARVGMQVVAVVPTAPPPRPAPARATSCCRWTASRSPTPPRCSAAWSRDAIGRRMEMTVWRNGALVDVVVEPEELRVG